jgi:hypothetical protein
LFFLQLINRLEEVIFIILTGTAAANIKSSITYIAFGLFIGNSAIARAQIIKKMRLRLIKKKIMILDKTSIIGQKMLNKINI